MNRNRAKGTTFESAVLPLFASRWPDAHRLGSQGAKDCGDIWLPSSVPFVVECKNEASYSGKLSGWLREAEDEARNADKACGVVVHKRRGSADPSQQYVAVTLADFLSLVAAA